MEAAAGGSFSVRNGRTGFDKPAADRLRSARRAVHPIKMLDLFAPDMRRNPFAAYRQLRAASPLLRVPPPFNGWMIFDYDTVKWVLNDHDAFSSRVPAPNWFLFFDPPAHSKLRALISRAFTPRMIAGLEPRIRELSRELLDAAQAGHMDLASEYAVPLAMKVIAEMIGIPPADWPRYRRWSDVILGLSYSRSGGEQAERTVRDFHAVTAEMSACLEDMLAGRRAHPQDDLLTRLMEAEVDGERLSHEEILAFVQLLVVAGQETSSDLIDNAVLCLLEHPDQLARLRAAPELLPAAIEEVLRYRSPLQWMMRTPRRDVEVHGRTIPAGALVLPMIGSANRDERQFPDPDRFDITRDPNPHIAFGYGILFCLGAALSRLEARIALTDLLARCRHLEPASPEPWEPRAALHVHGPASLPLRFELQRARTRADPSRDREGVPHGARRAIESNEAAAPVGGAGFSLRRASSPPLARCLSASSGERSCVRDRCLPQKQQEAAERDRRPHRAVQRELLRVSRAVQAEHRAGGGRRRIAESRGGIFDPGVYEARVRHALA